MIEMGEALSIINAHMHMGRCPTAGCIGECAAMHETRPGIWWAALYIWDKEFNDSTRVAKWFTDIGATDILIRHVLHDTDNGDKDGACLDGARAWHVEFSISGIAVDDISKAANDVLAERERQIQQEGWTPDHDDQHRPGSIALAGACYASMASAYEKIRPSMSDEKRFLETEYHRMAPSFHWTWERKWWKPKGPRRDLVRAAALIIAEIERLDRRGGTE